MEYSVYTRLMSRGPRIILEKLGPQYNCLSACDIWKLHVLFWCGGIICKHWQLEHLWLDIGFRYIPIPHSVESPSMADPQWDIWYWGSKWNLHTVCWSVVGCERGTTSVYFGITYVCFIPSRLPVFAVEPQYLLQDFLFLSKVSFEGHIQNLKKNFMLV